MKPLAELQQEAERWAQDDPDPATRKALLDLLARGEHAQCSDAFAAALEFGTAGLRGEIGFGPNRMNCAVVARATAGLCRHLQGSVENAKQRGLCIGFDARHMSQAFAEETAAVAAGAGFAVHIFETPVPTPVLAFAVLAQRAAGGVMVTASHNPARDNGYKVYWENGAQIIPPHDVAIADDMLAVPSVLALPRMALRERQVRGLQHALGAAMERRYFAGVSALMGEPCADAAELCIAYTAMHGVGERFARQALLDAGFTRLHSVAEQAAPHPDFPTVAFPNPEEPGAMDLVTALGEHVSADLLIANDPDADRLALAARDRNGRMRALTGNQIGVLLADHLLAFDNGAEPKVVLSSIVSTPMIAAVARAHGAVWEPTLTGFKWIANRAMQIEAAGQGSFIFGFEEAIGFSAGALVRDKDGISSAVLAARLAATCKRQGRTLLDQLDALFRTHGVYLSGQLSLRLQPAGRDALMQSARKEPPAELLGRRVTASIDLLDGSTRGTPSFTPKLPPSDVVCFELDGGHRIMLRPSGTEPKLKVYMDVREAVLPGEPTEAAQGRAQTFLTELTDALRQRFSNAP